MPRPYLPIPRSIARAALGLLVMGAALAAACTADEADP